MKIKFAFLNGWSDLPHCWRYYLYKNPFSYEKNLAYTSITFVGFTVFLWGSQA